jgi:hypothetical protein
VVEAEPFDLVVARALFLLVTDMLGHYSYFTQS